MASTSAEVASEPSTFLHVDLEWRQNGQTVHLKLDVEGQGSAAQQATAHLSKAIADLMTSAVPAVNASLSPQVQQPATLLQTAVQSTGFLPSQTLNAARPSTESRGVSNPTHVPTPPLPPSPMQAWFRQNRARINRVTGTLLFTLAVLVPAIVPAQQRPDTLVMTILFALTGALLLSTAALPGRAQGMSPDTLQDESRGPARRSGPIAPKAMSANRRDRRELLRPAKRTLRPIWGMMLGLLFVIAGLAAPFALGTTSADERFIIMLGFAPVTVVGLLLFAIFGRSFWPRLAAPSGADPGAQLTKPAVPVGSAASGHASRGGPVSRVPQNVEYRAIVPAAIIGLLIIMLAVVALVIYATVSSAVR